MDISSPETLPALQQEKAYWDIINNRIKNGSDYDDGHIVVRTFIHQESNADAPGKAGGAAVAMNAENEIMQNELGITIASASLNPESVDNTIDGKANRLPFPSEFMPRPKNPDGSAMTNEELTAELLKDEFPVSYIQYAAMMMNGTDVVFPNYWTSGMLAIKAREYMIEQQKAGKPLWEDEHGKQYVWRIPKIIYANHSLPARIDEELSKQDPSTYKPMNPDRMGYQEEVYRNADAITVWTQAEKDLSIKEYPDIPDLKERMHVVKAPVQFDVERAKQIREEKRQSFFNGEINDQTLVYYYQGRFEDYKHPEMLLQSFIDLYNDEKESTGKDPDIACLLVGGPFVKKDGTINKVYKNLLDKLEKLPEEMKKRISIPGPQEKEAGHAAGDVLVFPSIKESLGLTLVEAVLAGRLVVARSNVPTVVEANGHSGFYAINEEEFKLKMTEILHDTPEQREVHHQKLLIDAVKYTPQQTASDLQAILANVGIQAKKDSMKNAA